MDLPVIFGKPFGRSPSQAVTQSWRTASPRGPDRVHSFASRAHTAGLRLRPILYLILYSTVPHLDPLRHGDLRSENWWGLQQRLRISMLSWLHQACSDSSPFQAMLGAIGI
nr:hypothetical protein CFP56_16563 [Quercus suber]